MIEGKANLFVVGAMKAGTTSFTELLAQHAEIYCPPIKEPHFFVDSLPKQLYDPGPFFELDSYFKSQFPETLHITKLENEQQYRKLFSLAGDEKHWLDSSTAYLHAEETASRIHSYNPDAKIIVLVRDPMKRAFSHYKMDLGKGRIKDTFEEMMQQDIAAYRNNQLSWYSYLGMSLYDNAIHRYRSQFSQVFILNFEDLIENESSALKRLSEFLGIAPFENIKVSHKNIARKPKYPGLFYVLNTLGVKHYFSKIFSGTFKQWLSNKTSSAAPFEMILSKEIREELQQIFKKESNL